MRILSDGYVHILNRADRLIRHISIVGISDAVHEESDLRDIGRAVIFQDDSHVVPLVVTWCRR